MNYSRVLMLGIMAVALVADPNMAHAKTFHCGPGDVRCLIAAINEANANGHKHNTIRLAPGTYTLTEVENLVDGANGLPSITGSITIESTHRELATLERAPDVAAFRLLHVAASAQATLVGLVLRNGSAIEVDGSGGGLFNCGVVIIRNSVIVDNRAANGGGLYNCGVMTVEGTTVEDNEADFHGAIVNTGELTLTASTIRRNVGTFGAGAVSTDGSVHIDSSQFVGNRGRGAGALFVRTGASMSVNQTTFSGNGAQFGGGAIDVGTQASVVIASSAFIANVSEIAAIVNRGMLAVSNSTLWWGGRLHADVQNSGQATFTNSTLVQTLLTSIGLDARVFLQNSIVASTFGSSIGSVVSLGNNVIESPGVILQPTDLTGAPGLDAFVDDGSPGNGHFPLLETSQAIDAGNNAVCPTRDQLGQLRDRACDIGAIEFQNPKDE
jgi:hypothetical protein